MYEENEMNSCGTGCDSCAGCGGHDHEHEHEELDFDPIITLTDENGKDIQFEILDVVVLEDSKQYLVVAEVGQDDDKDTEVTILEIKEEDGEEVYDTVTDKDVAEKVFAKFEEQQEDYEVEDEE